MKQRGLAEKERKGGQRAERERKMRLTAGHSSRGHFSEMTHLTLGGVVKPDAPSSVAL